MSSKMIDVVGWHLFGDLWARLLGITVWLAALIAGAVVACVMVPSATILWWVCRLAQRSLGASGNFFREHGGSGTRSSLGSE
eukprot:6664632-Heterocapsa_arctica.AAC.1